MSDDQLFALEVMKVFAWPSMAFLAFCVVFAFLPYVRSQIFGSLNEALDRADGTAQNITKSVEALREEAKSIEVKFDTLQTNIRSFSSTIEESATTLESALSSRTGDQRSDGAFAEDIFADAQAAPLVQAAMQDIKKDRFLADRYDVERRSINEALAPSYDAVISAWSRVSERAATIVERLGGFPKQSAFNTTIADFMLEKGVVSQSTAEAMKSMFSARKSMSRIKNRPGFTDFGSVGLDYLALCAALTTYLETRVRS